MFTFFAQIIEKNMNFQTEAFLIKIIENQLTFKRSLQYVVLLLELKFSKGAFFELDKAGRCPPLAGQSGSLSPVNWTKRVVVSR